MLILVLLVALITLVGIVRAPRALAAEQLGLMSQRWLAEHRAMRPS